MTVTNQRRDPPKHPRAQCTTLRDFYPPSVHSAHPNRKTALDFEGLRYGPILRDKLTIPPEIVPYNADSDGFGGVLFTVHRAHTVSGSGGVGA